MNINIWILLAILFTHWVADFVCQTNKMATGKSKNWTDLLNHTSLYSAIFLLMGTIWFPLNQFWAVVMFSGITFVAHTATDYVTSRINARLWEQKKVHWFFVSIGFDQFLHYTQLLLTYYLLNL